MTISELSNAKNSLQRSPICVLDSSSYLGFWILKGLLSRGYSVHAAVQNNGETEIMKNIKDMGAAQMCENGVLACVDLLFLTDVHIRAVEAQSASGRYFCFNQTVKTDEDAMKLAKQLSPL